MLSGIKRRKAFLVLVVLIMILVTVLPTISVAADNPTLYIDPAVTEVRVDQSFIVELKLRDATEILGADVILHYDENVLQIMGVTVGVIKDLIAELDYTTTTGTVSFAASNTIPADFDGMGEVILTITFKALQEGLTDITFGFSDLTALNVAGELVRVVPTTVTGTVKVSFAVVTGRVTLPGRGDHSGVYVTVEGAVGISTITDAAGNFTLGVPQGLHTLRFEKDGFLVRRKDPVNVQVRTSYSVTTEILDPGDANNDNQVDLLDLTMLALSYDAIQGTHAHYDIRTDFNADGKIDLADLTLLASSYRKVGD